MLKSEPMSRAPPELSSALREIRSRLVRAALLEVALLLIATVLVAISLGALVALAGGAPAHILLAQIVALVCGVGYLALRYGQVLRDLKTTTGVAQFVDEVSSSPASVLSAVELVRDGDAFGESELLRDVAVSEATVSSASDSVKTALQSRLFRSLKTRLIPFGASLAAIALLTVATPTAIRSSLGAARHIDQLEDALKRLPPEPRLGDIRLTLRYPAYSERRTRTIDAPTGRIRALPGTEVTIQTTTRQLARRGALLVSYGEDGDETSDRTNVNIDGRTLQSTIVVSRSGRYRFQLEGEDGVVREERRGHDIELELDEPPEIKLIEPNESPLEVNESDRVKIVYEAKDDFALGEVFVTWRVLGSTREGSVKLSGEARGLRRFRGEGELKLPELDVKPGDRIAYTLEARDNDTVSGPKLGASATQELRIYSEKAHHQEVLALEEKSLNELVHILGDNLERAFRGKGDKQAIVASIVSANKIVDRAQNADALLIETILAIRKDPLGKKQVAEAFEQARKELLKDTRRKRIALRKVQRDMEKREAPAKPLASSLTRAQGRMVQSLEKNVVYLADLLNDQRMIEAASLAKELRAEQQALKKALEDYKKAPDERKRALIAQAIGDIRKRINEIMSEMAKLSQSIPQAFVNRDALDMQSNQAQMDRVEKMLEEGDLQGAMEALDKMLGQTEKMLSELKDGREELESREYSEITERAQQIWDDLQKLADDQRKLARRTEKSAKSIQERMQDRLGNADSFVEKQVKRLEQAEKGLAKVRPDRSMPDSEVFELSERRIADGKRALQARDFGAAQEVLRQARDQMKQLEQDARRRLDHARRFGDFFGAGRSAERIEREIRRSRPIVDQVLKDIEELMPDPNALMTEKERADLQRQRQRQKGIERRTKQLKQDLDELGQQLPIVGPEMGKMVQEAGEAMGGAEGKLGQGNAPAALNQERQALETLERLKQELEKMNEQGGGGGGGVPLPFGQPQGGGQNDDRGRDPRSSQKVEIPQPEAYKPPAEFREDILEAAKQGTVESYRDAVRRYYEELVQ